MLVQSNTQKLKNVYLYLLQIMFSHCSKIYLPPELVKRRQERADKTYNIGNDTEFVDMPNIFSPDFMIYFHTGIIYTPCSGPSAGHKVFIRGNNLF